MATARREDADRNASLQVREAVAKQDNVFDFLQNRILTHYPQAAQILRREMPTPRMAIVYPTYVCNQNCTWCEYSSENSEHHSMMTDDDLRKLVVDLDGLGVKGVEFCGGGEPSLHPVLTEVVCDLAARGIRVGILTNGTRLKGDLAEALIDHGSYVRVGFDGGTEETVHRVKRPRSPEARFGAVCDNVRNMVRMRNERGTRCHISMKVVVDQANRHEIEDAVALAASLQVDSVQFKAARVCDTELTAVQSEEVDADIARCKEMYRHRVVVIGGATKVNTTTQCWLTPLQLTIDALGEVYLCCYYTHRKEKHTIGNCFRDPLRELWYDEGHWKKIDAIEPCECNNLDCRFVKYNEIMNEVMRDNDAQFEFI